jgi:YVTN family beta-propeller protein
VAVHPDGSQAWVVALGQWPNPSSVAVIDTATYSEILPRATVGAGARHVAIAPDGAHAWVSNQSPESLSVIDTSTRAVSTVYLWRNFPHAVAVSPDGRWAYSANLNACGVSIVDTASGVIVADVPVGCRPVGIAFSPDGARAYVVYDGFNYQPSPPWIAGVTVIDTATRSAVGNAVLGDEHWSQWAAVTPDGAWLYVTDLGADVVSVIDTATLAVHATIPVTDPNGVTIAATPAIEVAIDVKPGSTRNPITLGVDGVVPVAILGSAGFDPVAQLDRGTLRFCGAAVKAVPPRGRLLCAGGEVSGDGIADLVCQFLTKEIVLGPGEQTAVLEGETWDGTLVHGEDTVVVTPP